MKGFPFMYKVEFVFCHLYLFLCSSSALLSPTIPRMSPLFLPNAEMVHLFVTGTKMKRGTMVPARLVHVVGVDFLGGCIWGGEDQPELEMENQRVCNFGSSVSLQ
ncbi:hypothetical protein CRENBAI_005540 [Crenichthys baileyi]|uniref:Secreted protein n=1 Tax=Crenichthys baileyi TaxID=28760 RepID=A0AAV9QWY0_9TELE